MKNGNISISAFLWLSLVAVVFIHMLCPQALQLSGTTVSKVNTMFTRKHIIEAISSVGVIPGPHFLPHPKLI